MSQVDLGGGPTTHPVYVIDCGYATTTDDTTHWNNICGPTGTPCPPTPTDPHPHQYLTTLTLTTNTVPLAAWCAGTTTPLPNPTTLTDLITRRLHTPPLGISPDTGTTLTNLRTLLWTTTPTTTNLGTTQLLGLTIELRTTYHHTDYDFGDHTTATTTTPGTPYNPAHDCGPCTTHFGHTYTTPTTLTITAHTYYTAQYRITGQPWTTLPTTVTPTNPTTTTLTIHQATSILTTPR